VNKLLIIKLDHIGDVLWAFPAVAALKASWPHAVFDLVCTPYAREAGERMPGISRVHDFDPAWPLPRRLAALAALRREGYDTALVLGPADKYNYVAWASGARTRIGYHYAGKIIPYLLDQVFMTRRLLHPADAAQREGRRLPHEVEAMGQLAAQLGAVLPARYVPLILMLLGLMLRGVSFEFHALSRRRAFWGAMFGLGSLLAALAQGFALGGLLAGIHIVDGRFVGGAWDWLSPFSIAVALGVVAGYAMLGSAWLILKTRDEIQAGCYRRSAALAWVMLLAAVLVSVWTPLRYPDIAARWLATPNVFWFAPLPLLALGSFVGLLRALRQRSELAPFVWTALIFLFSFGGLAASLYPWIVPGALTLTQAAASTQTLVFMLLGVGMLVPVMVAYNIYQYAVFRGKVDVAAHYAH